MRIVYVVVDNIAEIIATLKDAVNMEIYPLLNGNRRFRVMFNTVLWSFFNE